MSTLLAAVLTTVASFSTVAGQECGNLIKSITFEGYGSCCETQQCSVHPVMRQRLWCCRAGRIGDRVPYVQELAYQDFAPYAYLDGFHSDDSTRGTNNERAFAVQEGPSRVLEVVLPEGCVTSACAMQSKSVMMMPVDEATLKFRCYSSLLGQLCTCWTSPYVWQCTIGFRLQV